MFLASWAVMMGPMTYGQWLAPYLSLLFMSEPLNVVRHLTSGPRLPFTAAYFGSIAATLYFALGVCQASHSVSVGMLMSLSPSAQEHPTYSAIGYNSGSLLDLVSCQLLSYGFDWPAIRSKLRYQQNSFDDRLNYAAIPGIESFADGWKLDGSEYLCSTTQLT